MSSYYRTKHIVTDIKKHIDSKEPFSFVRFGDGCLKLMKCLLKDENNCFEDLSCRKKFITQSIDSNHYGFIKKFWKIYANNANYIDSFDCYLDKNSVFYKRYTFMSLGTRKLIRRWREIYKYFGIENTMYCNPDISYLIFVDFFNFLDFLAGKNICIISSYKDGLNSLYTVPFKFTAIMIPPKQSNHFQGSFGKVKKFIRINATKYDAFLIAGGVIGKIYAGMVKQHGGIALDIGNVIETWVSKKFRLRNRYLFRISKKHPLMFSLRRKIEGVDKNYI